MSSSAIDLSGEWWPPFVFLVRTDLGLSSSLELNGASIGLPPSAQLSLAVAEYFKQNGMSFAPFQFSDTAILLSSFFSGELDTIVVPLAAIDPLQLPADYEVLEGWIGVDDGVVQPTDGPDAIIGTAERDILRGLDGEDTIDGQGGDDQIQGDGGTDLIRGGADHDTLMGGIGGDTLSGGAGLDELFGESGNDRMNGGADDDRLSGGGGNDQLFGDAGDDAIAGWKGSDRAWGGKGDDWLYGGAGSDRMFGEGGNDGINGGAGADSLTGGAGIDVLRGDGGNDTLSGGSESDSLYGGSGHDQIDGGSGGGALYGGDGNDTLSGSDGVYVVDGGRGDDRLVLLGSSSEYELADGDDPTFLFLSRQGEGFLFVGIETFVFSDRVVAFADLWQVIGPSANSGSLQRPDPATYSLRDDLGAPSTEPVEAFLLC